MGDRPKLQQQLILIQIVFTGSYESNTNINTDINIKRRI